MIQCCYFLTDINATLMLSIITSSTDLQWESASRWCFTYIWSDSSWCLPPEIWFSLVESPPRWDSRWWSPPRMRLPLLEPPSGWDLRWWSPTTPRMRSPLVEFPHTWWESRRWSTTPGWDSQWVKSPLPQKPIFSVLPGGWSPTPSQNQIPAGEKITQNSDHTPHPVPLVSGNLWGERVLKMRGDFWRWVAIFLMPILGSVKNKNKTR